MSTIINALKDVIKSVGGTPPANKDLSDHIRKIMPFGTNTEMVEIMPEESVKNATTIEYWEDFPKIQFTAGRNYIVEFDGKKYPVVGKSGADNGVTSPYGDNGNYLGNPDLTDEPFFVFDSSMGGECLSIEVTMDDVVHTLAIYEEQEVVTQLPAKFRGFGEEVKLTEFAPEQTVTTTKRREDVGLPTSISLGKLYVITINGKTYECEPFLQSVPDIGDFITISEYEDIFSIINSNINFNIADTYTFSIYEKEETVTKLDIKYLPIDELKTALGLA